VCALPGRGLCDWPIPLPEKSYRVCACVCFCVSLSVNRGNKNSLHLKRVDRRGQNKKERKEEVVLNRMLYRHCFSTLLYNVPLGRSSKQEDTMGVPRFFFLGGRVQQIQLRTEDRENGDLGAVAS